MKKSDLPSGAPPKPTALAAPRVLAGTRVGLGLAHANIALAKYWGKEVRAGNYPAVPSLSVTLRGLSTSTRVVFSNELEADTLVLNGDVVSGEPLARAKALLDRVRAASKVDGFAQVVSCNDFPTASGLASSASGFAALAFAAAKAAGLDWELAAISDLARRSSASAARSLFGGFVELPRGVDALRGEAEILCARPVAPADQIDLRVLVCVTSESKKAVSSTRGMLKTQEVSPYYAKWVESAPASFERIKAALMARDVAALGEAAEASALAMHACAMAAGVVYVSGVTLEALSAVRGLRARGVGAWATMDAGPHVKVLVREADAALVGTWMRAVPGVVRVIAAEPGDGARELDHDPFALPNSAEAIAASSEVRPCS